MAARSALEDCLDHLTKMQAIVQDRDRRLARMELQMDVRSTAAFRSFPCNSIPAAFGHMLLGVPILLCLCATFCSLAPLGLAGDGERGGGVEDWYAEGSWGAGAHQG